jgi:hypothetical protein
MAEHIVNYVKEKIQANRLYNWQELLTRIPVEK